MAGSVEAYPEDQATGYELGDLRGLIRVSVPRTRWRSQVLESYDRETRREAPADS